MGLQSGYFIGCLILSIPYSIIFLVRKDLRREMIFGSFVLLPCAFTAPLFIPSYWNVPYLFGYLHPFRIGIEDLLFTFFVGGIAAVIYEFLERKREIRRKKLKSSKLIRIIPYLLGWLFFLGLEYMFPNKSIYNLIGAGLVPGLYMVLVRKDLLNQSVTSGLFFSLLYFCLFISINILYPQYVATVYNTKNLLGIMIFNVPLEELLFAFATGASWSIFYEFFLNYRTS